MFNRTLSCLAGSLVNPPSDPREIYTLVPADFGSTSRLNRTGLGDRKGSLTPMVIHNLNDLGNLTFFYCAQLQSTGKYFFNVEYNGLTISKIPSDLNQATYVYFPSLRYGCMRNNMTYSSQSGSYGRYNLALTGTNTVVDKGLHDYLQANIGKEVTVYMRVCKNTDPVPDWYKV